MLPLFQKEVMMSIDQDDEIKPKPIEKPILFMDDWKKYPNAIVDDQTKNESEENHGCVRGQKSEFRRSGARPETNQAVQRQLPAMNEDVVQFQSRSEDQICSPS